MTREKKNWNKAAEIRQPVSIRTYLVLSKSTAHNPHIKRHPWETQKKKETENEHENEKKTMQDATTSATKIRNNEKKKEKRNETKW